MVKKYSINEEVRSDNYPIIQLLSHNPNEG